jgi:hypothetical protein
MASKKHDDDIFRVGASHECLRERLPEPRGGGSSIEEQTDILFGETIPIWSGQYFVEMPGIVGCPFETRNVRVLVLANSDNEGQAAISMGLNRSPEWAGGSV